MSDDGTFVVVWRSTTEDGDASGIYARRYTASAVPRGPELRVDGRPWPSSSSNPDVSMAADGSFIVAWRASGDLFAKRFNALGEPLAPGQ